MPGEEYIGKREITQIPKEYNGENLQVFLYTTNGLYSGEIELEENNVQEDQGWAVETAILDGNQNRGEVSIAAEKFNNNGRTQTSHSALVRQEDGSHDLKAVYIPQSDFEDVTYDELAEFGEKVEDKSLGTYPSARSDLRTMDGFHT